MKKKDSKNLLWTKVLTTLTFLLLLFASLAIKANVSEPKGKEKSICIAQNSNWNLPNFENSNSITIQVIPCIEPGNQCTYVTKGENSTETRVAIPCDFPVVVKTEDGKNDYQKFMEETKIWLNEHPGIIVGPNSDGRPSYSYVEIPETVFKTFVLQRQNGIVAAPLYYHVKN